MAGAGWCRATTTREGEKVQCMKRNHRDTEQHHGLDWQGRDVVWLEVSLPGRKR